MSARQCPSTQQPSTPIERHPIKENIAERIYTTTRLLNDDHPRKNEVEQPANHDASVTARGRSHTGLQERVYGQKDPLGLNFRAVQEIDRCYT